MDGVAEVAGAVPGVFGEVAAPGVEVLDRGVVRPGDTGEAARTAITAVAAAGAAAIVQAGEAVGAEVVTETTMPQGAAVAMSVATAIPKTATAPVAGTPATTTTPARIHQRRDIAVALRQDVAGTKDT